MPRFDGYRFINYRTRDGLPHPWINDLLETRDGVYWVGTVLEVESARRCLDAGAKFLTSTGIDLGVIEFALKHDVVVFPGAVTPTEVMIGLESRF